jgi:hypothetical protein
MIEAEVQHPTAGPETNAQDRSDLTLRATRRIPSKQFSNRLVPALDTSPMLQEAAPYSVCAPTAPLSTEDITRWATSFLVPTAKSFARVPASQEQIGESIPVAADLINVLQDQKKHPSERTRAIKPPPPFPESDTDSDDEEAALLRLLGF